MQLIVSHPTGNRNVRAVISSLFAQNMLDEFNTTLASSPESLFLKFLPDNIRNELLRRSFSLPKNKIIRHTWPELARIVMPRIGLGKLIQSENNFASIYSVYRKLDRMTASRLSLKSISKNLSAVYGYEDGALDTFKRAKELGLKCIYDLPIAFWETGRKLLEEEAERLPNWACTLGGGIKDSTAKLKRKSEELEMADMVISPSNFVSHSLPRWAKDKMVHMAPFGSPEIPVAERVMQEKPETINRPLRVLFAGSMTQRKGLGDLFNAIRILDTSSVELVVMGSLSAPLKFYRKELKEFIYEAGRPNDQVLALMSSCDVFCLPSIVEGRALVVQEAMTQGLPIIITENTGGADLVIEGETGFLVPIRSPEAIADKLSRFLENRKVIQEMGKKAQKHAAKYSWDAYGKSITCAIKRLIS
jgi:glycosyltransferase involved in cell wall biosynthesis